MPPLWFLIFVLFCAGFVGVRAVRGRTVLLLLIALVVGAVGPGSGPLSDRDFQQLMEAAVAASSAPSQVQPRTTTICVHRNLQPPFEATKRWTKTFEQAGKGVLQPQTGHAGADKSITAAMSPKAAVAYQRSIRQLPRKFVLIDKTVPPECVVSRSIVRGPNWERDESIVSLTFTRPALANGYAFIEEYQDCAGLCGTSFLRVFQKQRGKWTQVARTVLSVS